MLEYEIYCAGKFITTSEKLEVQDPFRRKIFATTYKASSGHLEKAIQAGRAAAEELMDLPSYKRYGILMRIAADLEAESDDFSHTLSLESAKPLRYARGEVQRAIQAFRVAAEESKRLPAEYISLDWTPAGERKEGLVKYFPAGLVAGISPFNFPLNLAVHKIAPAIASGCPIILKPSSSTPLSTLKLAQIIHRTGLPQGAVSILPMDRETGDLLVTDERVKLLSFTGSPEVGWNMKARAGKKKVVLELGGNAGVIISRSADLDLAVKKCLVGGFAYSGQVCIHAQRIYVDEDVFEAFAGAFITGVKNLKQGDPMLPETEISSMIDEGNAIRVERWVNEAIEGGARLLAGGQREGNHYQPTVLTATKRDMKVCSLEIFGPVITLEPYRDFKSAVAEVNAGKYGLQAGVFTNSMEEVNFAFRSLEVGGVIINDVPTFRVDHMPYGGVKDSGQGREGIKYAIIDMMEPKILVKDF